MDPKHHQPADQYIYHIIPEPDWKRAQAAGVYEPESLASEGFIHCSLPEQVIRVANTYYSGQMDLQLLRIDQEKLAHEVRYEDLLGEGECFPHIYGGLNLSAVTAICPLDTDQQEKFIMPGVKAWKILETDKWLMNADLTLLPYDLAGPVYRSSLPFSPMFDPAGLLLDAYSSVGIDVVVMLTQPDEVQRLIGMNLAERYQEMGFEVIKSPIPDFSVPEAGALNEPILETLREAREGRTIVIHCHAGLGRTGMFAACLAKVVFGMGSMEARAWVREQIPHAVETMEQFNYVQSFELPEE